jgi:hypothetical protein
VSVRNEAARLSERESSESREVARHLRVGGIGKFSSFHGLILEPLQIHENEIEIPDSQFHACFPTSKHYVSLNRPRG